MTYRIDEVIKSLNQDGVINRGATGEMLLKRAIEANLPKKLEGEVDYKALLWKYMSHVEWCEGVNYVKSMDSTNFSQEEIDAANLLNNNPYKYISDYIY